MKGKECTRYSSLTEAIHDTLTKTGSTGRLAERLGKSPSTLTVQMNPNCDWSHFAADNVLPALEVAGTDEPLFWLASQRNYACVPLPEALGSDCKLEFELLKTTKEFSDIVTEYADIMKDGIVEPEEAVRFRKECDEAIRQILAMADAIDDAVHVDPLPESLPQIPKSPTDRKQ